MSFQDFQDEQQEVSDFYMPDEDKIKLLQAILEAESGATVAFEDAEEVGLQLIAFYECLARDRTIMRRADNGQLG